MEQLAQRVATLTESETIKMAQMARELRESGADVIDLSLGEPDFDTPEHICIAAKKAIDDGYTRYTPVPGFLSLREAIAKKLKRDNNLDYTANQIVVSTGAKQSLINIFLSVVDPGDEVIVPAPYWVSYAAMVHLAEATMINIETGVDNDFKVTAAELEAAITDKTRMLIFSSPCNPSGSVYSKEELASLAKVIEKYPRVIVVSDEIYEYINFGGKHESIAQFASIFNQVVTVNGCSKGYAMTGWRVGYIAAPMWIAKACNKIQGQFTSGTCSIAQKAAEAAMDGDLAPTYHMRDTFKHRRDLFLKLLRAIPGVKVNTPEGAFYVFPDVSYYFGKSANGNVIADSMDFSLYILAEAHVSLVAGSAFGSPNCVRLSYATGDDKLIEAAARIQSALEKLS